uniref:Uncharacterized protein n=1 Tax=Arundo donax TaxID=35708 RepID=A0A0A9BMW8_ARUDO
MNMVKEEGHACFLFLNCYLKVRIFLVAVGPLLVKAVGVAEQVVDKEREVVADEEEEDIAQRRHGQVSVQSTVGAPAVHVQSASRTAWRSCGSEK